MLQFSLDEALANPPALIAEYPSNIEGKQRSGVGQKDGKTSKADLDKIRETEERNESVLSRWSDRASFQSFMNAIAMLGAKKQQEELQKQQQNKEMMAKFRLFMQQGQQMPGKQLDQRTIPYLQEQSKTFNPFTQQQPVVVQDVSSKAIPPLNNPTSTEAKVTNMPAPTIPKVRKVMKGGILVSMPINARHPSEGKTVEQPPRGDSGPAANYDKGQDFGNILDDILARTQGSQEASVVTVKRCTSSKAANQNAIVKKITNSKAGKAATTNKPQGISNNTEQILTADESKFSTGNQDLTKSKTSYDGSISIDHNLTIAMPGEHCKFKLTHTATLKESSLISNVISNNKVLDNQLNKSLDHQTISKSDVEYSDPFDAQASKIQMTSNMTSKTVMICDTNSDGQDNIKQTSQQNMMAIADEQKQDLKYKTNANPAADDKNNDKLIIDVRIKRKMECSAKGEKAKLLDDARHGCKSHSKTDIKPDLATDKESTAGLSENVPMVINDENVTGNHNRLGGGTFHTNMEPRTKTVNTDKPSICILKDDVTSIVTSSCELPAVLADIKQDPTAPTFVTSKQSIKSQSETDLKPEPMAVITSHSVVTAEKDINSDPLQPILASESQDQNIQPMSKMKSFGGDDGLSTKTPPETETSPGDENLDFSDDKNSKIGCEQDVNLNLSQEECDRINGGADAEIGSGDLVIDIGCEGGVIKTSSTRRITRRMRYLSFTTSESSESEEQTVSSFEWIRNLNEEINKDGFQNEAANFTPRENISCQTGKNSKPSHITEEIPPIVSQNQQNLAANRTNEDNGNKDEGFEVNGEAGAKKDVNDRKRKEYDDKSRMKTTVKKKPNREESRSRRVTRSMSHSDLDLSREDCNESTPEPRASRNTRKRRTSLEPPNGRSRRRRQDTSIDDQKRERFSRERSKERQRLRPGSSEEKSRERAGNIEERPRRSSSNSHERGSKTQHGKSGAVEYRGKTRSGERRRNIDQKPREANSQNRRSETPHGKAEFEVPEYRGKTSGEKSHTDRSTSSHGSRRKSHPEKQEPKVVIEKEFDEAPSLLSMVSGETFDVTVAQQELSDHRKDHKRGGRKKAKKKPTEWFLRREKEKERNTRRTESIPVVRERPPCLFYSGGKCSKGQTCEFKHVKIKELCRYYVMDGCDNDVYGMCPRMHDEFPCLFFHMRGHCSYNNNCKYSHDALTEETRVLLEKYIAETAERKQAQALNLAEHEAKDVVSAQERNIPPPSSNLTTATGPGFSQQSDPNKPGLSSPLSLTQPPSTSSVTGRRVNRLCSLSSYKPQLLSSLASSVATVGNQPEKDAGKTENPSSVRKEFLPGMFKER